MLMNQGGAQPHFIISTPPETVQREKEKARALRKTQWWQRQISKGVCHYCGEPFPPKELTMDHIVPLIRGGRSTRGNVAAACKGCNNKKKYLLPIEWEEYLRSLSAPTVNGMAVSHARECQEDDHGRM
jgi:5-methylcytosine-specific restriction enzyme A